MYSYKTIKIENSDEFVEKKSRFIGYAKPLVTEDEAIEFIKKIRAKHPDATHNVYAYKVRENNIQRYSDDGEPQGTAGMPVLNVIKMSGATDLCVVVTRYFGGILLGAGGLVRAYTKGAKIAVDAAGKSMKRVWDVLYLPVPYNWYERIKLEISAFGGIIRDTQFGADVELDVLTPEGNTQAFLERLTDVSAGTLEAMITGQEYRAFPITPE